jgi:hypothetical protein
MHRCMYPPNNRPYRHLLSEREGAVDCRLWSVGMGSFGPCREECGEDAGEHEADG